MAELPLIPCLTAALIVGYFLAQVASRRFDPFAPTWLFLVGYLHVYVIQAISYHSWAVSTRGEDLVVSADLRACWALAWFFVVYHLGPAGKLAAILPKPPASWSRVWVTVAAPPLALWGLYCALVVVRAAANDNPSGEVVILRSFPFVMLLAAILMVVTGRNLRSPRPAFTVGGLLLAFAYAAIWTFNGKRSLSLMAVLATICAYFVTRLRRPSWSVLAVTAFVGAFVVTIAIGWRNDRDHERSLGGFLSFIADFQLSQIGDSLIESEDEMEVVSYETTEYGGFILMMDTVPHKSDYDYGANYLRVFSTFIPRIVWQDKPIYGRHAWRAAWVAGSEFEREEDFASPAIGIMGATQLNGGAIGTLIVIGAVALLLSTSYRYFRQYEDVPWVQFFWAVTYFNAWFMVVNDDPMIWFYYNWGFTGMPFVVLFWWLNRSGASHPLAESLPEP